MRRCLLTPCLQPQMKTYRCPWCVSRTNHNILYFVNISRTSSLNPGLCLWKLRFSLAGRGSGRSGLHRIWGTEWARPGPLSHPSTHASTLALAGLWHKAQNRCTLAAILFKLWTFRQTDSAFRLAVPYPRRPAFAHARFPSCTHCHAFRGFLGKVISLSGTNSNPSAR